jgi:hypothetical protein
MNPPQRTWSAAGRLTLLLVLGVGACLGCRPSAGPDSEIPPAPVPGAGSKTKTPHVPVNLAKHFNGELTRCWVPDSEAENHLANLAPGRQELGGVEFEIRGVVQLQGQIWQKRGHRLPNRADGIRVGRACTRLHLLHANSGFADPPGTTVAMLVLHYADGTQEQMDIRQGEQVLDWWAGNNTPPSDMNTVIAWTGENPAAARQGKNVRLLRTTFDNPKPASPIATVDYVSALAAGAPFLVALTVE